MVKDRKTRLQRKKEKESLKDASKYLFLVFLLLILLVKFGLPALIKMAGFLGEMKSTNQPIEKNDTVPPMTPQLLPLPEATSSGQINVGGFGENGSTIELYLRGINVDEALVDEEGEFQFKAVHLRDGENEVYVKAKDDQGNISEESKTYKVTVDSVRPELLIESPSDGDRFFDNDNPITVKGLAEEEVDLKINGRFVMVENDGSFETTLNLSEGDNEIEAVARDRAGNETRAQVKVNYTP